MSTNMAIWICLLGMLATLMVSEVDSVVKCGSSVVTTNRIIGQTSTVTDGNDKCKPHQYPWMAFIQCMYSPLNDQLPTLFTVCDGSLVDDQWVLTAASCFREKPGYILHKVAVMLGAHNLSNTEPAIGKVTLLAKKVYRHYLFQDDQLEAKYDIAMIQLSHHLDLKYAHNFIVPICLPSENDEDQNQHRQHSEQKTHCKVVGWGQTVQEWSNVLRKSVVKLIDRETCSTIINKPIDDTQICAKYVNNHRPGNVDWGGPLQCSDQNERVWTLQGIGSYSGQHYSGSSRTSVFTNVNKFLSWINEMRHQ